MAVTAALQPSVGGLSSQPNRNHPDFSTRSFSTVLQHSNLRPNLTHIPDAALLTTGLSDGVNSTQEASHEQPRQGSHKGFPALYIPETRWLSLATTFKWSLVGKFAQGFNKQKPDIGRPSIKDLQTYFSSLDLKGDFSLGLLDNRHLLIQLVSEEDFLRLYSRMIWRIGKITMRIFKWTPNFHVQKESSLVPVWINLPRLPIHLFGKDMLFHIASLVGEPLRLDASTVSLKRPSVARVQIEIDLLWTRPEQIWIGYGDKEGFWQKVEYEDVPLYCQQCWHVGHDDQFCWIQNPSLKDQLKQPMESSKDKPSNLVKPQLKYVEKVKKKPALEEVELAADNERPESHQKITDSAPIVLDAGAAAGILVTAQENQSPKSLSDNLPSHIIRSVRPDDTVIEFPLPIVFCGDGSSDDEAIGEINQDSVKAAGEIYDVAVPLKPLPPTQPPPSTSVPKSPETSTFSSALFSSNEFPILPSPVPSQLPVGATPHSTEERQFAGYSRAAPLSERSAQKQLNVEATAWYPKDHGKTVPEISSRPVRALPQSFQPTHNYDCPDNDYGSWHTLNSDEEAEEAEDSGREDFLDNPHVRDDSYLDERKNRQARRVRDSILMRRGADYPITTRQSGRTNKGVPPKLFEPGL